MLMVQYGYGRLRSQLNGKGREGARTYVCVRVWLVVYTRENMNRT